VVGLLHMKSEAGDQGQWITEFLRRLEGLFGFRDALICALS
jgi:hypothetical protein